MSRGQFPRSWPSNLFRCLLNYLASRSLLCLLPYGEVLAFKLWEIYWSVLNLTTFLLGGFVGVMRILKFFGWNLLQLSFSLTEFPKEIPESHELGAWSTHQTYCLLSGSAGDLEHCPIIRLKATTFSWKAIWFWRRDISQCKSLVIWRFW